MSYIKYNPNPKNLSVGDCTIRAISCALGLSWEETYLNLLIQGYLMSDMPSSNRVWGDFLKSQGFTKRQLPDTCPDCYTIRDFCHDFPYGTFIVGTGEHVVTVINGNYYDSWDSGYEMPMYTRAGQGGQSRGMGYARTSSKEEIIENLKDMMRDAGDDKVRNAISEVITKIDK